ncbi:hypothetical protein ALC57_16511 [Trachymyrmex cornetzi]|uniref:Uncharacterized protein n=1 Tax=Trachymyrmex cornetzi TaxID=471704 RepID=A0A195DEH1_9HYME|nr:hypothetical protein ALC57_16511 [Trachymyrmex cornetzi]
MRLDFRCQRTRGLIKRIVTGKGIGVPFVSKRDLEREGIVCRLFDLYFLFCTFSSGAQLSKAKVFAVRFLVRSLGLPALTSFAAPFRILFVLANSFFGKLRDPKRESYS